jgi:predicted nucleotidyltransferase
VDSRSKVSVYAKRLAEVEQKLAATRDVNANLQSLLDKALTSQKQSSSNTSHLVKNIQMDLSRVSRIIYHCKQKTNKSLNYR